MEKPSGFYVIELTTGAWNESPKQLFSTLVTWDWKEIDPNGDIVFYQDQSRFGGSRKQEVARMKAISWTYYDGQRTQSTES